MDSATCSTTASLQAAIRAEGFAFVHGVDMREILAPFGSLADWPAFAESWNDLQRDAYMADGGRYRRRRHGVFEASANGFIQRKPHQAHYQAVEYNPLHGGIARWFEPIEDSIGESATMRTILACCYSLFSGLASESGPVHTWGIEVHQFRIEARSGEEGRPTPEGLHRDGVDYVLVLLIDRRNIASGMTGIHALNGEPLGHFTLTDPLDAALVDDRRVAHGVTPVEPIDRSGPAYRDVLVVTFKRQ
jgi:hypothetical protein